MAVKTERERERERDMKNMKNAVNIEG